MEFLRLLNLTAGRLRIVLTKQEGGVGAPDSAMGNFTFESPFLKQV
jgi:hypothetical protein